MVHATAGAAHIRDRPREEAWPDRAFDLVRGAAAYTGSGLLGALARTIARHPDARLEEAFNHKQVACKRWARDRLYEALGGRFGAIWVLGGWYGVLAAMIFEDSRFSVAEILSFDIDPAVAPVAVTLNRKAAEEGRFRAATADMLSLDYGEGPDLVINTSCEHLADLGRWLERVPRGAAMLLQSNDYFAEPEHVGCFPSLEAFREAAGLAEIVYAGELPQKKYTRFMLIGRR
jgi:hypothetical protein